MHPEVVRDGPGECPKCGMALEPMTVGAQAGAGEPDPELVDMTRRFWVSVVLTVPVLILAMGDMVLPGDPIRGTLGHDLAAWLELGFATPVVLWCGWPLLVRGWKSIVTWNLNMFTLIGIGVGAAYLYSVVAAIAVPAATVSEPLGYSPPAIAL